MQLRKSFTNELVNIVKELVRKDKILVEHARRTWEQLQTHQLKVSRLAPTAQEQGCSVELCASVLIASSLFVV